MIMRDSISKNQACKLLHNQRIAGRWNQHSYRIIRELGFGATGTVFLAESKDGLVALKIAADSMSITSEVNVLRHFSKVQGPSLGPSFYDADDYVSKDGVFPFYTMEYINGEEFLPFLKNRGGEWIGILLVQLLGDLHHLHQEGWIFGDLKPENLLVTGSPSRVRWLDVGGITKEGRAIKEYTEFFDRGYWGLGNRKGERSYDLFSASMLIINIGYPARFEKNQLNPMTRLLIKVKDKEILVPYLPVIQKGLEGKFENALVMRGELMTLLQRTSFTKQAKPPVQTRQGFKKAAKKSVLAVHKKESPWLGVFESMIVASSLMILYILYLFGQTV